MSAAPSVSESRGHVLRKTLAYEMVTPGQGLTREQKVKTQSLESEVPPASAVSDEGAMDTHAGPRSNCGNCRYCILHFRENGDMHRLVLLSVCNFPFPPANSLFCYPDRDYNVST